MIDLKTVSRDFEITEAMQAAIDKHVDHLEKFFDRIERCELVISSPHQRHQKGRIYHIRIGIEVPGNNIVVNREPEVNGAHEDFYVALRDAFRAATRMLQDHVKKMRDEVKRRSEPRRTGFEGESSPA